MARINFRLTHKIMAIALNEVADQSFLPRLLILLVVAVVITVVVYGVVAGIVKMDDIGLTLTQRSSAFAQKVGRGLVAGMPKLLSALSVIGTVAMLWVGGHILLIGVDELGWHAPYGLVHHAEEAVHHVGGVGGGQLGRLGGLGLDAAEELGHVPLGVGGDELLDGDRARAGRHDGAVEVAHGA